MKTVTFVIELNLSVGVGLSGNQTICIEELFGYFRKAKCFGFVSVNTESPVVVSALERIQVSHAQFLMTSFKRIKAMSSV